MSTRTVFIIIIIIFIGSIAIGFSSAFVKPKVEKAGDIIEKAGNEQKAAEEENQAEQEKPAASDSKSVEGVVRKLEISMYMEGTHYLEAGGIVLTLLESTKGINLDKYVDKNVKVLGKARRTVEGDGVIMDVEKVEITN